MHYYRGILIVKKTVSQLEENYNTVFPHTLFLFSNCPAVPPGKKLTARLACLRSAKTHCKEFVASSGSLKELFTNAMYHADEQVVKVYIMIL